MKIQKKYQGAIPLNRIANEHNESEVNTYSTQYLNNKFEGNSSMGSVIVEDISCKNLFKLTESRTDYLCTSSISGNTLTLKSTGTANGYANTNYITFEQGKTYTISFKYSGNFSGMALFSDDYTWYNNTKTYIGTLTFTMTETKSLSLGFYVVAGGTLTISNIQVEEGNTATKFVEHKEISNMQIYSRPEQQIGTWIDNKPLYRRVYTGTVIKNGGILFNLPNINTHKAYGTVHLPTEYVTHPIGGYASADYYTLLQINDSGDVKIFCSSIYLNSTYEIVIEYTKKDV
jgi:hypothetical protein